MLTVCSTDLEDLLFSGATRLYFVSLANNQISSIGKDTFKGGSLTKIDLSGNQLTHLNYETFSQLNSLTTLLLPHNKIILKYGIFPRKLEMLDLSHNQLKQFSIRQLVSSRIEKLKLNGNNFYSNSIESYFPRGIVNLGRISSIEVSDCFECPQLADTIAYLAQVICPQQADTRDRDYADPITYSAPAIYVGFKVEKKDGANIDGISCAEVEY